MITVSASILAADFSALGEGIRRADAAGVDWIHLDVMDGHFVPNITFGPPVVAALRRHTGRPFDTHLMIAEPERYLADFAGAGSDIITVHYETVEDLAGCIEKIRALGVRPAVSVKPGTDARVLEPYISSLYMVLCMTVEPGFGGQGFIESTHRNIRAVREMADRLNPALLVQVDGGIKAENIARVHASGADCFVVGSALFGAPDMAEYLRKLRESCG